MQIAIYIIKLGSHKDNKIKTKECVLLNNNLDNPVSTILSIMGKLSFCLLKLYYHIAI